VSSPGDKASFNIYISEELHKRFALLSGDMSAAYTSANFARTAGFKGKIGYAGLLHALLSRLYGEYLPGGQSVCVRQTADYKAPYYIGDVLTVQGEVHEIWEAEQTALIKTTITSSEHVVMLGEGLVKLSFAEAAMPALYKSGGSAINSADVLESLSFLREGDSAFIHSDIVPFGTLAAVDRDWFFDSLLACFIKSVGLSGNILMPAFTYSFCKNEIFDVQNSPSTVGALTEAFRKRDGILRSLNPIFSAVGVGVTALKLLTVDEDCFGGNSIFGNLLKDNAWLIFFGVGLRAATFVHFIEQSHTVPYRYTKRFEGAVANMGAKYETYTDYYVRDLALNPILETESLEKRLTEEGALKITKLGEGFVKAVKARDFYEIGLDMLKKDIYAFVKINTEKQ
jgi:aminoglycoside 3-N-acetyltransferase